MTRRSIHVDSARSAYPIPAASRIGPLVMSSVIRGRGPAGERVPHAVDEQLVNLFRQVGEILAAAGAGWRHVARMNFYVPDLAIREAIDGPWLVHFPDPTDRPARHTQLNAGDSDITCDFVAYVDD
jgi:enamine deaminase RidA (YjgF/YER057c/UK114 family)